VSDPQTKKDTHMNEPIQETRPQMEARWARTLQDEEDSRAARRDAGGQIWHIFWGVSLAISPITLFVFIILTQVMEFMERLR